MWIGHALLYLVIRFNIMQPCVNNILPVAGSPAAELTIIAELTGVEPEEDAG